MTSQARCPDGIGLVLLDLDGTVLRGSSMVSRPVRDALLRCHNAGIALAVSSGRPYRMVPRVIRRLGAMDYYVCTNGSAVSDGSGRRIFSQGMTPELALKIMGLVAHLQPGWNAFVNDRGYAEFRNHSYMLGAISSGDMRSSGVSLMVFLRFVLSGLTGTGFRDVLSVRRVVSRAKRVDKLGCSFSSSGRADEAQRILLESGLAEVARMNARELEITTSGVDKGSGAAWLGRHLGVGKERMVAFGDGANDLPLTSAIGCFVAMGNADKQVKAQADDVCPAVSDDGVAQWLNAWLDEHDL